jgi:hypothetical protein
MSDPIPEIITTDRNKVFEIVSRMLDEPGDSGIYRTTRAYNELEELLAAVRAETVGYVWAEACSRLDRGEDPRKVEIPEIFERTMAALNRKWSPPSEHP